jgi:hypothetical protein
MRRRSREPDRWARSALTVHLELTALTLAGLFFLVLVGRFL